MTEPTTLSVRDLLATAADYRRMADEIETHVNALIHIVKSSALDKSPAVSAARVSQSLISKAATERRAPRPKPPGIMTSKWIDVLHQVARQVQDRPFGTNHVIDAAMLVNGRVMRPADVRRQFQPYLSVGYLVQPSRDLYQITPEGFAKIGFEPEPPLDLEREAPNENGPATTPVTGWGAGPEARSAEGWPSQS